ncbi:unnamed protein product, partial [Rotaria magnacalcarata]
IRKLPALPVPPRSVIIERLPPLPPKPRKISNLAILNSYSENFRNQVILSLNVGFHTAP